MKVFSSIYEYSKEKSSTMLNKKKNEVEVEKKRACWAKTFFEKFEETKKTSYEYMEKIHNKIKTKSSSLFANFSFLKFDYDSKYNMFPWYTRLYFILKDQIKKINNLTKKEDSSIISTEINKTEKKNNKKKLSEDYMISSSIDIDEADNRSATYSKYSNDLITHRNCKKLKRNNTENINGHLSGFKGEEISSQDNSLFSKRHTSTIVNTLRSIHKNKSQDAEEQFCDVKEITEVTNDNNKEEYNNTFDISNKNDVTEKEDKVSNKTEDNTNINANEHALANGLVKKFNIKNTWAKFSNIIS